MTGRTADLLAKAQRERFASARRIGSMVFLGGVLAILLAGTSVAQDAGVSGIPQGPGNINGPNGSGRDPSGIGNASKMAPLPGPSVQPVTPPAAAPLTSTRVGRVGVVRPRWSRLPPSARRKLEEAAVKENDRLLKHGITSICRGC
jgi:hypothetical protein